MPSSRRDQEILHQLARELADEDPALVRLFRDWSAPVQPSGQRWGRLLGQALWTPRSFLNALLGVLMIAVPACYICDHLARHSSVAALLAVPLIAVCLLPMYRYLERCDRPPVS